MFAGNTEHTVTLCCHLALQCCLHRNFGGKQFYCEVSYNFEVHVANNKGVCNKGKNSSCISVLRRGLFLFQEGEYREVERSACKLGRREFKVHRECWEGRKQEERLCSFCSSGCALHSLMFYFPFSHPHFLAISPQKD